MNLLEQFQTIRDSAEHGLASALHFEAEGAELVRSFRPNERLILLGGGNIAQPLCRYAADLGFSVIVADDRPTFANRPRFPEAHTVYCDRFENATGSVSVRAITSRSSRAGTAMMRTACAKSCAVRCRNISA